MNHLKSGWYDIFIQLKCRCSVCFGQVCICAATTRSGKSGEQKQLSITSRGVFRQFTCDFQLSISSLLCCSLVFINNSFIPFKLVTLQSLTLPSGNRISAPWLGITVLSDDIMERIPTEKKKETKILFVKWETAARQSYQTPFAETYIFSSSNKLQTLVHLFHYSNNHQCWFGQK